MCTIDRELRYHLVNPELARINGKTLADYEGRTVAEVQALAHGTPARVAGLAYGAADELQWAAKERAPDFFDVKGDVEALLSPLRAQFVPAQHPAMHPGRCARVMLNGQPIGFVGELHPQWRQNYELPQAPLMFELELDAVLQRKVPEFTTVSKHQAVERDIAVLVDESVTHAALMETVWAAPTGGLLRDALLFDVYRPKAQTGMPDQAGTKSLAVRLTLHSLETTLTEEQIDAAVQSVLGQLAERLGALGYRTAAVVSAFPLDRQFGLSRGFDVYDQPEATAAASSLSLLERRGDASTDRALAELGAGKAPQFNATKGCCARGLAWCMAWANSSLPVPLSPVISTLRSVGA